MSLIECMLEHIRKTNPNITRDELIKQLNKSSTSAVALAITSSANKK